MALDECLFDAFA
ncbi:hypothetical protein D7151_17855 [Vibrio cholerae]|nr:hypothetical protein [Vibrio cholerae]